MLWFVIVLIFYVGILLGYKPEPFDLRQKMPSFQENFQAIRGSLFLGVFLIVSFLIMSDFGFRSATSDALTLLAINNGKAKFHLLPFQAITHLFTHINMVHLLTNYPMGYKLAIESRLRWVACYFARSFRKATI